MNNFTNKIDFAVLAMVTDANPNGDPLNGNRRCMHQKKDKKSITRYGREYICSE